MNKDNYVVIMAGGIGSRFWPYSRNNHPKQFLDVLGTGSSLLQMTFERFHNICPPENIYIVTNESYAELVKEQLPSLSDDQILLEPIRRNTAPCTAYACFKIGQKNPDANIIITPSDHAIFKEAIFEDAILKCLEASAKADRLITLGIKPNRPETGYGYIQYHKKNGQYAHKVKTFTEKPQLELAKKFIESGDFVWNAGIFIWNYQSIKAAFEKYMPDLAEVFEEGSTTYFTENEAAFIQKAYSQAKNISIDYGIMEKAENVYMVLGEFGWSDLGSWNSLHEIKDKDEGNNVIDANALTYEVENCVVKAPKDKLMVLQGLDGFLVAECDNVLLICKKDLEQKFREFVSDVKSKKGTQYL